MATDRPKDDHTDYEKYPVEQTDNSPRPEDGDQSQVSQERKPQMGGDEK